MRCRSIDRNHDIQIFNECSGIGEVVQLAGKIEKVSLWPVFQFPTSNRRFRRVTFLQAEKIRVDLTERASENIERNISAFIGGP